MFSIRIVDPNRNIYYAFILSFLIHSFFYASYFYLKDVQKENMIMLTDIELIEIEPDIPIKMEPEVVPAQRAPKNVLDIVKMAFFQFKKPEMQEVSEPKLESTVDISAPEKIDLDRKVEIKSKPKISLERRRDVSSSAKLSEVVPHETELSDKIAMLPPEEAGIDLAEVGKVAVRPYSASTQINLDKKIDTSLKDDSKIDISSQGDEYELPKDIKGGPVSFDKKRVVTGKSSSAKSSRIQIGYSKGGISLKKYRHKTAKTQEKLTSSKAERRTESGMIKAAKVKKKTVELIGPLKDRKIVVSYLPMYPDWARIKHIEADVVIRFFVSVDGKVKDKMQIVRTSGYSKLDKLAKEALKEWIFEKIDRKKGEQWGVITFRYLLE